MENIKYIGTMPVVSVVHTAHVKDIAVFLTHLYPMFISLWKFMNKLVHRHNYSYSWIRDLIANIKKKAIMINLI